MSPRGGNPPMDEKSRDLDDSPNQAFLLDPEGMAKLEHSLTPAQVSASNTAGIYYAGGHGLNRSFCYSPGSARKIPY
jgi:hypothetical protein